MHGLSGEDKKRFSRYDNLNALPQAAVVPSQFFKALITPKTVLK